MILIRIVIDVGHNTYADNAIPHTIPLNTRTNRDTQGSAHASRPSPTPTCCAHSRLRQDPPLHPRSWLHHGKSSGTSQHQAELGIPRKQKYRALPFNRALLRVKYVLICSLFEARCGVFYQISLALIIFLVNTT